jgi:hypothetical protein
VGSIFQEKWCLNFILAGNGSTSMREIQTGDLIVRDWNAKNLRESDGLNQSRRASPGNDSAWPNNRYYYVPGVTRMD